MAFVARYPLHCDVSFAHASRRTRSHRALKNGMVALRQCGGHAPAGPLPVIPVSVPELHWAYRPDPLWTVSAMVERTAAGLMRLFAGEADEDTWVAVVDHLQHLLHSTEPHRGSANAHGATLLLIAGSVLPDHPWAQTWAMAGSVRTTAWVQGARQLVNDALWRHVTRAAHVVALFADVAPAMPAEPAGFLGEIIDLPDRPAAGLYGMHPSDDELTTLLSVPLDEAVSAMAGRVDRLAADRWFGAIVAGLEAPDRAELDEICENVLTLRAHMHVKHDFGRAMNWATVLNGDVESNVSLNHHVHIMELARGYNVYGEARYAEHAVRLLRSWFDQSPCPEVWGTLQWRTLEVGGRLNWSWPVIMVMLRDYEPFQQTCLREILRWIVASARYLAVYAGPWNNWLQVEAAGMLVAAELVPEWRDAALIGAIGKQRLAWINGHMFLPDGMQSENAPHYHTFPWSRLYIAALVAEAMGGQIDETYWAFLHTGAEPFWKLRMPDGGLPPLSDAGPRHDRPDQWVRLVAQRQARPDLLGVLDGDLGVDDLPDPCQRMPHAGLSVVRTGWGSDDAYVLFDHGFFGTNHQHEDKLTFIYAAGGRPLVGDAGIYRYSDDPWERYYRGAWGHNVVMVDGKQQCRANDHFKGVVEPIPDPDARQQLAPGRFALLSGWYREGFAPRQVGLWNRSADRREDEAARDRSVQHHRLLLYVWNRGLLVIDRVLGESAHRVDQVFHLQPFELGDEQSRRFEPGELCVDGSTVSLAGPGGQTGVALHHTCSDVQISGLCGQLAPPRGWTALYGEQPSHDVHCRLDAALPVTLGVWIEPVPAGQAPSASSVRVDESGGRIAFEVHSRLGTISGSIDPNAVTAELTQL